ncbi:MAG: hypothetical protein ACFCUQ_13225 [Kiloniellales bacterium]
MRTGRCLASLQVLRAQSCLCAFMLGATVVSTTSSPVWAASYFTLEPYVALAPLADEELAELRGGFFDIFGASIEFGAEVRTMVDGSLLFQTNFVQTAGGLVREQVFVPDPTLNLSALEGPIERPGLPTIVLVGGDKPPVSSVAPSLSGLNGTQGIVLTDASGITAALHQIGGRVITNGIVNTASSRNVQQELEATITLHGFSAFEHNMRVAQLYIGVRNALAEHRTALNR